MPTYEYRCPSCGNDFERFQRMSDPPGAECPTCGTAAVRRVSGGAGLLFKGSGFYITDYRGEGYKKAAGADKAEKGDKGEAKSGDSAGSESKPSETSKPAPKPSTTD